MIHQRLAPIAMEGRGVLARYFPGEEELTVWSSTQIPHLLRTQLALMIGIPENKLRVITPEVGGGFGSKLNVYAEEALLGWIRIDARAKTVICAGLSLSKRDARSSILRCLIAETRSRYLRVRFAYCGVVSTGRNLDCH